MSVKMQLVKLDPVSVDFPMGEKEPSVTLKVENTSDKMVAFKIKTTHPKRYLVRPNQGVIPVGSVSSVQISLQIKDAKQLRQEKITGYNQLDQDCKDNKFLVQCAAVKETFLPKLQEYHKENDSKALGNELKDMWAETTRDELVHKKLTCTFNYPESTDELLAANNLPIDLNKEKAELDGSGEAPLEDYAELRKKYQELINFTVQLTAERDRFKASLKDATKEIAVLKKGDSATRSARSAVGSSATAAPDATIASPTIQNGYALWQVMLVAVLAYLMAKLFTFQ